MKRLLRKLINGIIKYTVTIIAGVMYMLPVLLCVRYMRFEENLLTLFMVINIIIMIIIMAGIFMILDIYF